jgi:hypothetical protein
MTDDDFSAVLEDVGTIDVDDTGPARAVSGGSSGPVTDETPTSSGPEGPDEPPAHAREPRRRRSRQRDDAPRKPARVTQAIRGDIESKISFALEIPGRVWQARDPVCGSVFIEQRPEMAAALTEIVCGSPDLVAWFTGTGGQFMLWLNLAAACWPVATMVMAHHVYHSIEVEQAPVDYQQPPAPDYSRYAA